jgi:glycosyltransferase involved in cell wall biosynthesis
MMRLGIATICPHVYHAGQWWSYEPFVLEMNIWSELFDELVCVAPQEAGPPPQLWAPYRRSAAVTVIPYRHDRGRGLDQPRTSLLEIPAMLGALIKAARSTDAFHVRSPGSIGLVASLLLPLLQQRRCAKYAGQWGAYPGEARSVRLQRALLRSRWWGAPVTVYGDWPGQPGHIVPFFTSVLGDEHLARARASAVRKVLARPARLLFVGRLSAAKQVGTLIAALERLRDSGVPAQLTIAGDGPEREALVAQVGRLALGERVTFVGALPFEQVLACYEQSDILVLASQTEGWPKAIAEAMAFGLVCIGSDQGLIPWMLAEGRGLTVPPGDAAALAAALGALAGDPQHYQAISRAAAAWAQQFSLPGLRAALRQLLESRWRVSLGGPAYEA